MKVGPVTGVRDFPVSMTGEGCLLLLPGSGYEPALVDERRRVSG